MNLRASITASTSRIFFAALLATAITTACHREALPAPSADSAPATTAAEPAPAPMPEPTQTDRAVEPPAATEPGTVILGIGQGTDIAPSTTLTFTHIVSDSRCPKGAQCVWAGEITIALTLASTTGVTDVELSSRPGSIASAQSFDFEFVDYRDCATGAGECASVKVIAK